MGGGWAEPDSDVITPTRSIALIISGLRGRRRGRGEGRDLDVNEETLAEMLNDIHVPVVAPVGI